MYKCQRPTRRDRPILLLAFVGETKQQQQTGRQGIGIRIGVVFKIGGLLGTFGWRADCLSEPVAICCVDCLYRARVSLGAHKRQPERKSPFALG